MDTQDTPLILMADDDEDDCMVAKDAFKESGAYSGFHCVENGTELMDFLCHCDPLPALILLDLNMPVKDGRQVLREIKAIPEYCAIPIVILTTSREKEDIVYTTEMGAKAFITKPAAFGEWVKIMKQLVEQWLNGRKV